MTNPVVLCILDGWGLSDTDHGNAPVLAKTPNFDRLMADCPSAKLITHGPDAGLPTGQMGNSEVGHTNIGAGRVVAMDLGQIDLSIEDGSFFANEAILDFGTAVGDNTAHLIGLVSDGGVHSHIDHIVASAKALTGQGVRVVIHAIVDGRDVAPVSAQEYLLQLYRNLPKGVQIVSVSGRYYALDRDNRWDRVKKAYDAMALGQADVLSGDAVEGVQTCYDLDQTDEFIEPFILGDYAGMSDGDGVFFINFRSDRAREILAAIGDSAFDGFDAGARPKLSSILGMVKYSDTHDTYMTTVFPKRTIPNTLGEWVSKQGKRQFRLAETEKYPHVTFFLNGGVEVPYDGEDRFMPKSPAVATYDMQPEMSAPQVADQLVGAIKAGYDLIVVNFANPDMVGHTGDLDAAIKSCEAVDMGLGQALTALDQAGGAMIVTADHGNCEQMFDLETGGPHTAHTTNLVPVILAGGGDAKLRDGRLADLAPTVLALMGLPQPDEMTGKTLIQ
ncbi:MAG: 2,3-bisphosphoglycerate-independent phosphoglycerate mutase [Planktomarina sp.]